MIAKIALRLGCIGSLGVAMCAVAWAAGERTPPVGADELEKQFVQARALANGDGCKRDPAAAFQLYRQLAGQGFFKAQHNLALMYLEGTAIAKNPAEAEKWFLEAARHGALLSQLGLAQMYAKGEGIAKNPAKALEWYQKAAGQGSADAMMAVGEIYYFGDDGIEKDYPKAREYFQKAADHGCARAWNFLGTIHGLGLGVPRDTLKSGEYFRKGALKGDAKAQANYGQYLTESANHKPYYVEAYKWLRISADQGQAVAKNCLAELTGIMTPEQIQEGESRVANFRAGKQ